VYDIAQACRLALEKENAKDVILNIGSGETVTVASVAERLAKVLSKDIEPEVSGKYRVGDIRHCFPDISRARAVLGYQPTYTLERGMHELAKWLERQTADDRFNEMRAELTARGLVV
jgi:dTDP-L-rhamnose 4-epimerase